MFICTNYSLLATLIVYQQANYSEYNAINLQWAGDYLVGYKTVIPKNTRGVFLLSPAPLVLPQTRVIAKILP